SCSEIGFAPAPQAGEAPYVPRRHARLGLLPLRCLRGAILASEQVRAPLVESGRPGGDILSVVQTQPDPLVHDCDREGGIGAGAYRYPFSAEELRGTVQCRVDVDKLDSQLLCPESALRALCAGV